MKKEKEDKSPSLFNMRSLLNPIIITDPCPHRNIPAVASIRTNHITKDEEENCVETDGMNEMLRQTGRCGSLDRGRERERDADMEFSTETTFFSTSALYISRSVKQKTLHA